jgi:DNA-directed RNA polymerase subunit RPC12/RpoP
MYSNKTLDKMYRHNQHGIEIGQAVAKQMSHNYRCLRCGAFVKSDWESRADRIHYTCLNCDSCGYIELA